MPVLSDENLRGVIVILGKLHESAFTLQICNLHESCFPFQCYQKEKQKQICGMDVLYLANTKQPRPIVVSVMYPDFTGFFLMDLFLCRQRIFLLTSVNHF